MRTLFTNEQWLKVVWSALGLGAAITLYAMTTFEKAGASDRVKSELKTDINRVERKVDAILLHNGLGMELKKINESRP